MEFLRSGGIFQLKQEELTFAVNTKSERQGKGDKLDQVFTLFPKLPPELRDKIWNEHCAQLQPRIVDLWPTTDSTEKKMRYGTHSQAPTILHISREARSIGLQYYKLLFEEDIQRETVRDFETPKKPHIYVNWEHDILFPVPFLHEDPAFGGSLAHESLQLEMLSKLGDLQGLKRIAIPQTNTNWVLMLIDANNLSEIIVYEPDCDIIYNIFERFEKRYAAGKRFKLELVDATDEDQFPSCYGTPTYEDLLLATDCVRGHLIDDKEYWDLHSVQPTIKQMIVELGVVDF